MRAPHTRRAFFDREALEYRIWQSAGAQRGETERSDNRTDQATLDRDEPPSLQLSPDDENSTTASIEAVKDVLRQRGRDKERSMWQAARDALPGKDVSRALVRRAMGKF